ncbi:MAG TPA: DEAD/DEAH box helicase [Bryobacteraceae bacterium]|jgi:ATP-dependent RNA helicase RhlE
MNNFTQIPDLCPALKINLARNGFVEPTPVQAEAIPPVLEGRDIIATAQTGTGKTLAFALPIVQKLSAGPTPRGIHAVILSPTRELAIQIHEAICLLTAGMQIRSAVVVGGMNEQNQLRMIRKGAQIIVATPGRLCDFIDRRLVDLKGAKTLVLDEADRMLDMGFMPSIKEILAQLPATRQTLLFSATIEKSVEKLIESSVRNPVRIAIGAATKPVQEIDLHHYEVEAGAKLPLLIHLLKASKGTFLVFARTKRATDRLAKDLSTYGVKTARIHGDRTQAQRNQALAGFKNGSYRVLVATDVAARGIHVDGIEHVVNYDLPQVPEDFVHRAGRTGRAGAKGIASTFSFRGERSEIVRIERALRVKLVKRDVPSGMVLPKQEPQSKVIVMPVVAARAKASIGRRSFGGPNRRRAGR